MLKINIANLVMLIITMIKFIMVKPTMAHLIMVKLIMLNQLSWPNLLGLNQLLLNGPYLNYL
jgi:hypothetical protein